MRCALYARVSTEKQAEKYGIPSQIEALRKRCREKGWEVIPDGDREAFIDEGYSGAELDRPALNHLREAVRHRLVDVVLAYDPDRLSRKLFHQMLLAEELEKKGVRLEFISQEVGTSPEDRMFFNMRGLIAEYEREKIRERTLRGRREKARQGKVVSAASAPLGYHYNPRTQTLEEDPERAQVVRLAFYTYANEDLSLVALAQRLQRLGIPPPKGGKRWYSSSLGGMLRNETYLGRLYQFKEEHAEPKRRLKPLCRGKKTGAVPRPREEWIAAAVPPLVTPELFEAVQRKLHRSRDLARRNTRREYLLAGLLYCGICSGRMGGHTYRSVAYYRCYRTRPINASLDERGMARLCPSPELRADQAEPAVWQAVSGLLKDPELLIRELRKRSTESSSTRQVLERDLELCRERLDALPAEQRRLVEGYRKGLYPDFMMRGEMSRLQEEQTELERRKTELERRLALLSLTQDQEQRVRALAESARITLDELDFPRKQQLLRLLVEKVSYLGDRLEVNTVIPLNDQLHPLHREGARG